MPKDVKGVGARRCNKCRTVKRAERFHVSRPHRCKRCVRDELREHRKNHPELWTTYARRSTLKRRYGITPEQYNAMLAAQGSKCAICSTGHVRRRGVNNFAIDHDHDTGTIRGLLCHNCNRGLGHLKDSADLLRKAIAYLEVPRLAKVG